MKTLSAASKIDSIVIYNDRVLITRRIEINLKQSVDIMVPDLPGALDDQSVRTRAPGLRIGEIQVKTGYKKELRPEEKDIEKRLKKFSIDDRTLIDEQAVLQEKLKFLSAVTVASPEVISNELYTGKVAPEAWEKGLFFVSKEMANAKNRIAQIERERVMIKEKMDTLRRELQDIRAMVQNRKTVLFDVHPKEAKKYTIDLDYIIYGASWRTYYELRADIVNKKVDLTYFGKVTQRTGEDWDDVAMTLSTARPVLGGSPPEPYPWYIDLYVPRPATRARVAAKKAEAPAGAMAEDKELQEEYAEAAPVDTGISITYPLPGRYSIKSGEPETKLLITRNDMDTEFEYFIMPRSAEQAYSTGTFKNSTDYLFLAGDASIYVGDDLTGHITLDTIAPEEEATTGFGIDDRVKVERKTKKRKVSKGGLMKKMTKYEYEYENTIENFHKREITCKIIDQIPVPQNPDIKLSGVKIVPKPTEEDKPRGIFEWKTSIPAGEKFVFKVAFVVEAPHGAHLEGMS